MKRGESAKEKEERASYQRWWVKARDSGAAAYAAMGPEADRERMKMRYLAEATEAWVAELERGLRGPR